MEGKMGQRGEGACTRACCWSRPCKETISLPCYLVGPRAADMALESSWALTPITSFLEGGGW
jgi:hypothetical protein